MKQKDFVVNKFDRQYVNPLSLEMQRVEIAELSPYKYQLPIQISTQEMVVYF